MLTVVREEEGGAGKRARGKSRARGGVGEERTGAREERLLDTNEVSAQTRSEARTIRKYTQGAYSPVHDGRLLLKT